MRAGAGARPRPAHRVRCARAGAGGQARAAGVPRCRSRGRQALSSAGDAVTAPAPGRAVDDVALELRAISAAYGRVEVLRNVDLVVRRSEIVALLGPNGAGKSTLVKVASGQLPARQGSVHFDGADVTKQSAD